MSDRPHGPDWWQGPDGRWHPPENRPDRAGGRTARPSGPNPVTIGPDGYRSLTSVTAAALVATALAAAWSAIAFVSEAGTFDPAEVDSAADPVEALGGAAVPTALWSVAAAASMVLLIIWMYRSYRRVAEREPAGTRWSAGWAVGGWFIPLAAFVIPKLVVNEIDRISHREAGLPPIGERWKGLPVLTIGHWWWALTVVGTLVALLGLGTVAEQIDTFTLVEQTYRAGLQTSAAGLALWAAGSVAGAAVVWQIGGRLSEVRGGGFRPATG